MYFTRWKALGIILTALIVCLCAVPNFFPEAQVKKELYWPKGKEPRGVAGVADLAAEIDAAMSNADQ